MSAKETTSTGDSRPYDQNTKRTCTDVICTVVFAICILGAVGLSAFGYLQGDAGLLFAPLDSEGKVCGYDTKLDESFLFFFDLTTCWESLMKKLGGKCPTTQICLKVCPTKQWSWELAYENEIKNGRNNTLRREMICKQSVSAERTNMTIRDLVITGECAGDYFPSKPVFGRCIPTVSTDVKNISQASRFMESALKFAGYGQRMLDDVIRSKWYIVAGVTGAMLLSCIWITLMAWIAAIIVWIILLVFAGLLGYASYYGFKTYFELSETTNKEFIFTTDLTYYFEMKDTWLALSCTSTIMLLLVLLVLLILRKRVQIAVALIKMCSRAIMSMMGVLLWPLCPFVLQVCALAMWATTAINLLSVSTKLTHSRDFTNNNNTFLGFITSSAVDYSTYLQIFMIFMAFWILNFIVALGRVTVGGSFCEYYWKSGKAKTSCCPVIKSFSTALRYHTGTMAFGSLIISLTQLVRFILVYVETQLQAGRNKVAVFMVRCLKCCFWCIEKLIKRINNSAYIMVAIQGTNFCNSIKALFLLLSRNVVRLAVVDNITDFVLFIGKLSVAGATAITAFLFFDGKIPFTESFIKDLNLNYSAIPIAIIAVAAYIVASTFFNVFSAGVDTLFLCFVVDLDINDGSTEKPYNMSKELMQILGKKNDANELKDVQPK